MSKRKTILGNLLGITILPLCILGIIMTYVSWQAVYEGMCEQGRDTLSIAAHAAVDEINLLYPGALTKEVDAVVKGETPIDEAYDLLEAFQQNNDVDMILFVDGEDVLSTVKDDAGDAVPDLAAPKEAESYVCEKGMEYYSIEANIAGEKYLGYFVPFGSDTSDLDAMLFAGEKVEDVIGHANTIAFQIVATFLIFIILVGSICILYVKKLVRVLKGIRSYLGGMADGSADVKMDPAVLKRTDEVGDTGRYAVTVNESLSKLITMDPLTELYNRRACRAKLAKRLQAQMQYKKDKRNVEQTDLTVVIGDIDFFKVVNDTYGHECGDIVLKKVADTLKAGVAEHGFVSRWGGEEFLLVLDLPMEAAYHQVEQILMTIREIPFQYKETTFGVTMTFGMKEYEENMEMDELIRLADECLYEGKDSGRNRIIGAAGKKEETK